MCLCDRQRREAYGLEVEPEKGTEMRNSSETPYVMILFGLALFGIGMVIDVVQHGLQFIMSEFRHAPLAHGLPLAGILLILVGTLRLWSSVR